MKSRFSGLSGLALLEAISLMLPRPFFSAFKLARLARRLAMFEQGIETRVEKATQALTSASEFVDTLRGMIDQRKVDLQRLNEELDRLREATKVSKEQARALREIIKPTVGERVLGWIGALIIV